MTLTDPALPPADIQSEAAVLGGAILDADTALELGTLLSPDDYFRPAHRTIHETICRLVESNRPVDLVAMSAELSDHKLLESVGGLDYLISLAEGVPSAANSKHYAERVREKSRLRQIVTAFSDLRNKAMAPGADADAVQGEAEDRLLALSEGPSADATVSAGDAAATVLAESEKTALYGKRPGIPTGIGQLDQAIDGLRKGHLITLAAPTSVGKSALAMTIARNVAASGGAVVYVSAEMEATELALRLLAMQSGVPAKTIEHAHMTAEQSSAVVVAQATISEWKLLLHGQPETIGRIGAICRKASLRWRTRLNLIVVDYLQIMRPPPDGLSREQQVSAMAMACKHMASAMHCPVLMLAQVNRDCTRERRPPELHDLRESGAIEQHSNTVLFLHRPDDIAPQTGQYTIWARVAKQRSGYQTSWPRTGEFVPGAISLLFSPDLTRFE